MRSRRGVFWLSISVALLVTGVALCAAKDRSTKTDTPNLLPRIEFGDYCTVSRPGKITPRAAFPVFPRQMRIYKVKNATKANALMWQVMHALPIKPDRQAQAKMEKIRRDPAYTFLPKHNFILGVIQGWGVELYANRTFQAGLEDYSAVVSKNRPPPTVTQARKTADAMLAKLRPMLPEKVEFANIDRNKNYPIIIVNYRAKKNKWPITGGVRINVGPDGQVYHVESALRLNQADRLVPILSPREAFARLCAGEGRAACYKGSQDYLDTVQLVYWEESFGSDLTYLMPVYVFSGASESGGKKVGAWNGDIEAIRPEYLEPRPK
jgi:hypothetical protein